MADGTHDPIAALLEERADVEAEVAPAGPPMPKRVLEVGTISVRHKALAAATRRWALECIAEREAWADDRAARLDAIDDEIARLRGEAVSAAPAVPIAAPVIVDDSITVDVAARERAARILIDERQAFADGTGPIFAGPGLDAAGRSASARLRAKWDQQRARHVLELDAAIAMLRHEDLGPILAKAGGRLATEAVRVGGALAARRALGEVDPAPRTVVTYREPPPPPHVARDTHDRLWRIVRRPNLANYLDRSGVDAGDVVGELLLSGMRSERTAVVYRGVPGYDLDGVLVERAWQMARKLRTREAARREVHFVVRDDEALVWTADPEIAGDVPDPETILCMRED